MKNVFRRVIKILDSQPAGARGQSLIELAFTTPILFMMIVSTAEIGFLANNYLILLDAVREGARHAVTDSPITNWHDYDTRSQYRTACKSDGGVYNWITNPIQLPGNKTYYGPAAYPAPVVPPLGKEKSAPLPVGFFDSITCQTVAALDPLHFVPLTSVAGDVPNDVVVSVVSYLNVCNDNPANCYQPGQNQYQIPIGSRQLVVTGRWPLANRECSSSSERDPFDFPGRPGSVTLPASADGKFRGFVMTGHSPSFTGGSASDPSTTTPAGCYGSRFAVSDIETLLNSIDQTGQNGTSVLASVPSSAAVIVELAWQHHQLFGFPPLNLLGNPELYIYQLFPVSAAEPTPTAAPILP